MSDSSTPHSADASAIGYYHQGGYALVVLLDSSDAASVSVETADDVVKHDDITSLHQLKHSMGTPPAVTVKNDGLWNTIGFWADGPFDGSLEFVFVTCASIGVGSELEVLKVRYNDRSILLAALEAEARRVGEERKSAKESGEKKLPYAERGAACARFLSLKDAQRKGLVDLMQVTPESFSAADLPTQVARRLQNCVDPNVRSKVVERLIEWWDRQVALSLMGKRKRRLDKLELQIRIHELIVEHSSRGLPNSFQDARPESLEAVIGTIMRQQIIWVKGGKHRVERAALARWRARNQREEWLEGDFAAASELDLFDKRLHEAWCDKFHPMKEDCEGADEDGCCNQGRDLLDWSHLQAFELITPIRENAPHIYIVQGTLQQFAEHGDVGWHPGYEAMLVALKAERGA